MQILKQLLSEPDTSPALDGARSGKAGNRPPKTVSGNNINLIPDDPQLEVEIRARLMKQGDQHILLWERMIV